MDMKAHTTIIALLFCMALHVHAEDSCSYVPMSEIKRNDPWLTSANASALTRYNSANSAEAILWLTKAKGGHVDYNGSPDDLTAGASVESFFRLTPRAVVYGAISYTNFSGHDMTGSAFINSQPSIATVLEASASGLLNSHLSRHIPFDIVEDSLTNPGTKHLDTYRLTGALGYDLCKGFSLGARLDYTAANYAKYKDLRHKNKLMDMNLTAGFLLPLAITRNTTLSIGANYLYHRTTESVQFSTYGKNDKVYNSLIAYANFMGHVEQFGNSGFTDKSREMPLVSDYNGMSVQFSISPSKNPLLFLLSHPSPFRFYNSFTYAHRRGYYGRPSPYTITYTGHESDIYHYDARLSFLNGHGSEFSLDLSFNAENLRNDASNYRELQNEQGATYYEYYTPVKTANKLWVDGTVALTADLGIYSLPLWTLQAGLNWHHRKQTAYSFPFVRRQRLTSKEPFVCVCHNIAVTHNSQRSRFFSSGYWTLALHASFLEGSGQPFEDLTYQTPSEKQEPPATMDAFLWREYQWLTAAQYEIGGSVKYSFVPSFATIRTFIRADISHRKANNTNDYSQGCDRTTATLSVGCNF